jgi:transcriptional regulator with XRE-family HTH domain
VRLPFSLAPRERGRVRVLTSSIGTIEHTPHRHTRLYPMPRRRSRSFAVNGKLLRSCRVAKGWTQDDAAAKAGVSDRLIRKAESGGPLEIQSIAILAQLYSTADRRLTPDDLLAEPLVPDIVTSPSSSASRPEALVRRFLDELWNQRRYDVIDELATPDCVLHAEGRDLHGRAAIHQRATEVHAALSDIDLRIQELTVVNDLVICRWRATFAVTGVWRGMPPTGKRLIVRASTWIRVAAGWLVEGWDYWDEPLDDVVVNGCLFALCRDFQLLRGCAGRGRSDSHNSLG